MVRKILNISKKGFLSLNEKYRIRVKNEPFKPLNARKYRSMKIMFHKKIPKYAGAKIGMRRIFSYSYNGAGFIVMNLSLIDKNYKYNIYDINSAFQSVLINKKNIYPMSIKTSSDFNEYDFKDFKKKYKSKKFVCFAEFYGLKAKYDDIAYNVYIKQLGIAMNQGHGIRWYGWVNDIDLSNIIKLYNYDKIVIKRTHAFENVGRFGLELHDFINSYYNELHTMKRGTPERKDMKTCLHICTYGKNVQKVSSMGIRSKYVLIGMYQSAYVRQHMINVFIKYHKNIIYMDTDSVMIRTNAKFKEKVSEKIGEFKIEYQNVKLDIFRPKAYIIYDTQGNILEQKFSGLKTKLNYGQIQKIKLGQTITIQETRKNKMQNIQVYNLIKNGYKVEI